ncbi:DM13 domain-containing protein [Streptomyces sp. A7024]|uniref:DM13 domain-containing protein n=1 Tax=Streptomyces coryli TaxID=1128680 RepID=A0A6G4TT81_9ACTN|nr:DM13 domain-containing protein [Streptomyces coryli]NGN63013.1 DM13 domain-containing protein [Streptomyces coryli]
MGRLRRTLTKPLVVGLLLAGLVAGGAGLYWFQPWKLWVDETVQDADPAAAASSKAPPAEAPEESESAQPPAPKDLATGDFITHEHATSGSVRVIERPDGSRVLRLENLDTSNGPDLRVWVTDAPVKEGRAGWKVFDDGKYRELGKLKGNKGSQNYELPADVDLDTYGSVSIWCKRFAVSFGAAELAVRS